MQKQRALCKLKQYHCDKIPFHISVWAVGRSINGTSQRQQLEFFLKSVACNYLH